VDGEDQVKQGGTGGAKGKTTDRRPGPRWVGGGERACSTTKTQSGRKKKTRKTQKDIHATSWMNGKVFQNKGPFGNPTTCTPTKRCWEKERNHKKGKKGRV